MNKYQEAYEHLCKHTEQLQKFYVMDCKAFKKEAYAHDKALIKELVDKATPYKPIYEADGYSNGELVYDTWICPSCETRYEVDYDFYDYCPKCGQKILWEQEDENS